jgi:hypothetical protein
MKAMLLSRLKVVVGGLLVLAVGFGGFGLTYRSASGQVNESPRRNAASSDAADQTPRSKRVATDELEELRLQIEALRHGLQATREQVKALQEELEAMRKGAEVRSAKAAEAQFQQSIGKAMMPVAPVGISMGSPPASANAGTSAATLNPTQPTAGYVPYAPQRPDQSPSQGVPIGSDKPVTLGLVRHSGEAVPGFFSTEQSRNSVGKLLTEAEAALSKLREHPGDKQATRELQRALVAIERLTQPQSAGSQPTSAMKRRAQLQSAGFVPPDKPSAEPNPLMPAQKQPDKQSTEPNPSIPAQKQPDKPSAEQNLSIPAQKQPVPTP